MATETVPAATRHSKPPPLPAEEEDFFGDSVTFETPEAAVGHRVVLYGPGGIGKSSLADLAPGPVVSFDLDDSLGVLQPPHTQRVSGIGNWDDLLKALGANGWSQVGTLVIDSGTKAEELALKWTLENVPMNARGDRPKNIEDYGFGKGLTHLFDTWGVLLNALDAHAKAGRNVVMICHACTTTVPNPRGEDWIRYEPRLQSPNSGKASIRLRTLEWADHMFFMGYDLTVDDEKKARGGSTRTIYYTETPWAMAKNRMGLTGSDVVTANDDSIWRKVFSLPAKGGK